ncbi:hypothetical protein HYU22_00400 [Candidatus Woesearchaeota archaeon]|nr:hypothetical protein [Candidatus Woesearchaeota archaeon]
MQKLLIVLGMGGHTSQMLQVVQRLGPRYEYEYVLGHDDTTSLNMIHFKGKVYTMKNPRLMKDNSLVKVFFKMFPATLDGFRILRHSQPNAILSAGPSLAIPLFWLAKMIGIKTIFIESWVRVHHKSWAGRLVYPVSDLFFVQWESLKKVYPKAIFAGRLS